MEPRGIPKQNTDKYWRERQKSVKIGWAGTSL